MHVISANACTPCPLPHAACCNCLTLPARKFFRTAAIAAFVVAPAGAPLWQPFPGALWSLPRAAVAYLICKAMGPATLATHNLQTLQQSQNKPRTKTKIKPLPKRFMRRVQPMRLTSVLSVFGKLLFVYVVVVSVAACHVCSCVDKAAQRESFLALRLLWFWIELWARLHGSYR